MATELRVHGVSGSPAESMLDRPLVGRVAGDAEAGFHRPRPEYGATTGPGGATLEAYRWGNLTSGAAARAFWLLLLPFTLANVALWLRPPASKAGSALVRNLCRLFALTMTATFTLAAVGVSIDLVAWQCASPGSVCVTDRPSLNWAFTGFFAPTGRRLALAALVPLLLIAVLWELARRTWARYESYRALEVEQEGDGLSAPTFWHGRDQVGRLRSIHIATALAAVDAVLLYVLHRHDRGGAAYDGVDLGPLDPSTVVTTGLVLLEVTLAVLAACVVLLFVPAMVNRDSRSRNASLAAKTLRWGSLALTAITLGYALLPRTDWPTGGSLPGYASIVTYFFVGQEVLLLVLLAVVAVQRRNCKNAFLGGFGTPIVASMALGVGAAFSAGVSFRVADFLDGGGTPAPAVYEGAVVVSPLEPPVSFQWAAFGYVGAVLFMVLTFLWVRLMTLRKLRREAVRDTNDDFGADNRNRDPERAAVIDAAIANARLSDRVGQVIGTVWFLLAAAALVVTYLALRGDGPVQLAESGSAAASVLSFVTNLGTLLISLTVLGLIVLGIQAYRNEKVRRVVGVVWDLGTFWPRAAHPLAPPCYAERVVPELVLRTTFLGQQPGGVLLSGHSQGTVLAAATVLQLPREAWPHTALITYGSPLKRLYTRLFPAYVSEYVLEEVADRLRDDQGPRWTNLWRWTDPIGGEVGIGDVRLTDPRGFDREPGDSVHPATEGHGGYQTGARFGPEAEKLLDRLPQ